MYMTEAGQGDSASPNFQSAGDILSALGKDAFAHRSRLAQSPAPSRPPLGGDIDVDKPTVVNSLLSPSTTAAPSIISPPRITMSARMPVKPSIQTQGFTPSPRVPSLPSSTALSTSIDVHATTTPLSAPSVPVSKAPDGGELSPIAVPEEETPIIFQRRSASGLHMEAVQIIQDVAPPAGAGERTTRVRGVRVNRDDTISNKRENAGVLREEDEINLPSPDAHEWSGK